MWMKATFDHKEGRPIISRKFKPVAQIVLHRLEAEIAAGNAKPSAFERNFVALKLSLRKNLRPTYRPWSGFGISGFSSSQID